MDAMKFAKLVLEKDFAEGSIYIDVTHEDGTSLVVEGTVEIVGRRFQRDHDSEEEFDGSVIIDITDMRAYEADGSIAEVENQRDLEIEIEEQLNS